MCRVIADAVEEGRQIARRRNARPARGEEAAAAAPQRSADEEREFQERQAQARAQAAAKQREIEERARQARAARPAAEPATEGAGEGSAAGTSPADTTTVPGAASQNEGESNG
jgi:hypothetical protein